MRFNIANKAPINVNINDVEYALKRIRRPFWVRWSAEIDADRERRATEGLSPQERAKMSLLIPVEPTTHSELTKRIYTADGTGRIIREAAKTADPPMPDDVLEAWLDSADERDLESLAMVLASLVDFAEVAEKPASDKTEDAGPLAPSTSDSADSSRTS